MIVMLLMFVNLVFYDSPTLAKKNSVNPCQQTRKFFGVTEPSLTELTAAAVN